MMSRRFPPLLPLSLLLITFGLTACSEDPAPEQQSSIAPEPPEMAIGTTISEVKTTEVKTNNPDADIEIDWDDLVPAEFSPERLFEEYDLENMSDDDPRAAEFEAKLKELFDNAPIKPEMDGQSVKIPGFVVPVETDAEETTGFLLVPYYGACIHVPPPPANQTVYVVAEQGQGTRPKTFDIVWVTGQMSVSRIENEVAEAGYTIYANKVEPYE